MGDAARSGCVSRRWIGGGVASRAGFPDWRVLGQDGSSWTLRGHACGLEIGMQLQRKSREKGEKKEEIEETR